MALFGIEIRRPSFRAVTTSAICSLGLVALSAIATRVFVLHVPPAAPFVYFFAFLWAFVSSAMGIRLYMGWRHMFVFFGVLGIGLAVLGGVALATGLI